MLLLVISKVCHFWFIPLIYISPSVTACCLLRLGSEVSYFALVHSLRRVGLEISSRGFHHKHLSCRALIRKPGCSWPYCKNKRPFNSIYCFSHCFSKMDGAISMTFWQSTHSWVTQRPTESNVNKMHGTKTAVVKKRVKTLKKDPPWFRHLVKNSKNIKWKQFSQI